jgi:hypothetical protein
MEDSNAIRFVYLTEDLAKQLADKIYIQFLNKNQWPEAKRLRLRSGQNPRVFREMEQAGIIREENSRYVITPQYLPLAAGAHWTHELININAAIPVLQDLLRQHEDTGIVPIAEIRDRLPMCYQDELERIRLYMQAVGLTGGISQDAGGRVISIQLTERILEYDNFEKALAEYGTKTSFMPGPTPVRPVETKTPRAFLSYSSKNETLACEIRDALTSHGIDVFMAKHDIKPSKAWEEQILEGLKRTTIFLPLLTAEFHESVWTAQESGIAINAGHMIVPLKVDSNPEGFLAGIQALTIDKDDLHRSCERLVATITAAWPTSQVQ